jgi:calcium-dependent protein kinase
MSPFDRDLKPENILLSDKTPSAALKVIDFGTSDFCLTGQRLSQKFGTPYYVAPVRFLYNGHQR